MVLPRIALVAAVASTIVSGIYRWPVVSAAVLDSATSADKWEALRARAQPRWLVTYSTGATITVRAERDTATTEAVIQSNQVTTELGRIRRRWSVALAVQGGVVFVGVLLLGRIPAVRKRISP